MNIVLYIFAGIGVSVVGAFLFLTFSWFLIHTVAKAKIRRDARAAALTPPQVQ